QPNTLGKHFRCGWSGASHNGRDRRVVGREAGGRLDFGDRKIEDRISSLLLHNVRWKLQAVEVAGGIEFGFKRNVSQYVVVDNRFHLLQNVLLVQVSMNGGFAGGGERENDVFSVADGL